VSGAAHPLGTLLALTLAVGTIAAIDLRRLQTPRGTALAWTGAAVFGDCTAYLALSVPDPAAPQEVRSDPLRRAVGPDRRPVVASSVTVAATGD